jgi:cellulose synthase/poly-beta-1,6-N-acetylglucosamine synthase-like glycosyltransferase
MIIMQVLRMLVVTFFEWSTYFYFLVNSIYLFLLIIAIVSIRQQMKSRLLIESLKDRFSIFAPGISILAPAYNEEATIAESIKSFLMLDYPTYEIVVINDGSTDRTLERMKTAFLMEPDSLFYDSGLSQTVVRGTYRSKIHPNLVLIDKTNGGKADALNVGIGFAQHGIFCAVDSDSLLEEDALTRIVVPFIQDPDITIASGGTVRIVNGSTIKHGRVVKAGLPGRFLPLMQVIEYTRAFLCGRIGWNAFNATLVISGAFGLFSKSAVQNIGGYLEGSVGEDMELIVRIHRHYRKLEEGYRVVFIPDPVCWTEAPESLQILRRQRNRWQRGLADTLFKNKDMLLNPRFGLLGLFAFPYFFFVELMGPLIEVLSLICLGLGAAFGILNRESIILYFIAGIFYGILMNISSILMGEIYFSKYPKLRQFAALVAVSLVEAVGYRQLTLFWRLEGLYDYCRGNKSWGTMKRVGFTQSTPKPEESKKAS